MSRAPKRWFNSTFEEPIASAAVKDDSRRQFVKRQQLSPRLDHENGVGEIQEARTPKAEPVEVCDSVAIHKCKDWAESFRPTSVNDLAVNSKKVEEVLQWFQIYEKNVKVNPAAILLISGPPGSAKCTTVKLVCESKGFTALEWSSPVDTDFFCKDDFDFEQDNTKTFRLSQKYRFDKFLYKSSRYGSLLQSQTDKSCLIVKDFPNVFLRDPSAFHDSLQNYTASGDSPLVFIATETSARKLDILYNLFSPAVLTEFQIQHITFNEVATKFMQQAVRRIVSLMRTEEFRQHYRAPTAGQIDSTILSAQGDLRNVCMTLHYTSLKNAPAPALETTLNGSHSEPVKHGKSKTGRDKRSKAETKLKHVGCDKNLSTMHALGKVFSTKSKVVDNDSIQFLHDPENIIEALITQPMSTVSLIHSNYVERFTDIEDVREASNMLSVADILMSDYRDDRLAVHGLNVAIRGMMVFNRKTANGWHPIRKKKTFNNLSQISGRLKTKNTEQVDNLMTVAVFATDYKGYANIIAAVK